jgi:hypothetical protein
VKSSLFLVLITCGMYALTVTASAEDQPRDNNNLTFNQGGASLSIKQLVSKLKKHHDKEDKKHDDKDNNPPPIDPGKGDGKPIGRPGFVWVGDHWEREKATSTGTGKIVDPIPGTIVVRDHRKPVNVTDSSQAAGGGTVTNTPIIRDHRTPVWGTNNSNASGGVTVTGSPIIRDHRGATATSTRGKPGSKGKGGGILGTLGGAVSGAVDAVGDAASTVGSGAGKVVNSAGKVVGISNNSKPAPAARVTIVRDHR